VLDDLSAFTTTRLARPGALAAISADFQVIYLTTSDRYDAAADLVQVLTGPTLADRGAAGAA
jgi:hypothetical protein